MESHEYIIKELIELNSSLPVEAQKPVFTVPIDYFENFAAKMVLKVKTLDSASEELNEISPLLASIYKHNPYTVPQNYFSSLQPALVAKEDEVPAFLADLKAMPYTVPEAYFETLPQIIAARVATPIEADAPKAKVISISPRWKRFASAAAVAGIIAISGIFYFQAPDPVQQPGAAWVANELKDMDDSEIEDFIQTTEVMASKGKVNTSRDVRALLSEVSVDEMDAFLNDVPNAQDDLYIIN